MKLEFFKIFYIFQFFPHARQIIIPFYAHKLMILAMWVNPYLIEQVFLNFNNILIQLVNSIKQITNNKMLKGRMTVTQVRTPLPVREQKTPVAKDMFIDEQFENIINKECPGKLSKLLQHRLKKRVVTQPTMEINHENHQQAIIFERTFFKERLKTAQKDRRAQSMRAQLKSILNNNERPVSPFFKINRKNIISLQRSSLQFQKEKSHKKLKTQSSTKNPPQLHPYLKITERTYHRVSQEYTKRSKQRDKRIIEFKPFGDIDPVDLHY